jgi:hypothetical protein
MSPVKRDAATMSKVSLVSKCDSKIFPTPTPIVHTHISSNINNNRTKLPTDKMML